jgi:hypothetical protein
MMNIMTKLRRLGMYSMLAIGILAWTAAQTEARSTIDYGQDLGVVSGIPDGTNFAMQFTMDWHVRRGLSIGPMIQFVPPGDFMMIGGALATRYRYDLKEYTSNIEADLIRKLLPTSVVPFLGMGGMHTFIRRGSGADRFEGHDSSYYVPIGVGVEWELHKSFSLSASFAHNFHDISYGNQFGHDRGSEAAFFGLRYRH